MRERNERKEKKREKRERGRGKERERRREGDKGGKERGGKKEEKGRGEKRKRRTREGKLSELQFVSLLPLRERKRGDGKTGGRTGGGKTKTGDARKRLEFDFGNASGFTGVGTRSTRYTSRKAQEPLSGWFCPRNMLENCIVSFSICLLSFTWMLL